MDYVVPAGLFVFMIAGLIAINVRLAKRPTFKETDERYKEIKVCDVIHKSVEEKLKCIPEIKETVIRIETILNGRKKE